VTNNSGYGQSRESAARHESAGQRTCGGWVDEEISFQLALIIYDLETKRPVYGGDRSSFQYLNNLNVSVSCHAKQQDRQTAQLKNVNQLIVIGDRRSSSVMPNCLWFAMR
jgi:hypothetical protein